jgi:hypothetical protein
MPWGDDSLEPSTPYDLYLNRLTPANGNWIEGTHTSGTASPGEVNWNHKKYLQENWAGSAGAGTAGIDFISGTVAIAHLSGTEAQYSAIDFTFSDVSFINNWAAGNNPGLIARAAQEGIGRTSFYTRESSVDSCHPELIINFTPIPEPSSLMLLGVGGFCVLGYVWRRKS